MIGHLLFHQSTNSVKNFFTRKKKKMNFETLFKKLEIEMKECPFKLKSIEKPKKEDIENIEKSLNFNFSNEFKEFQKEIGPGNLGRVKIFGTLKELNGQNLIFHSSRLERLFLEQKMYHSFPMKDLIIFGQDIEYNSIYYGFKRNEKESEEFIYAIDHTYKSPPPKKISKSFLSFIQDFCIGIDFFELDILEYFKGIEDEEEDDDEQEEEKKKGKKVFVPFPSI